jgi:hypothetical protein
MNTSNATTGLQLWSLVTHNGELELSLKRLPIPTPDGDEVVIRVLAAPINPSDLGLLFGPADMSQGWDQSDQSEQGCGPVVFHCPLASVWIAPAYAFMSASR